MKLAPWMLGWALGAAILIAMFGASALAQTFIEPDSAMRLVQVRDFLGGQGWYDLTQYRLNPPDGVLMHWARWVDAAIAVPILVLSPVFGREAAEVIVAFVWPLAWLAAFVFLMTRIAAEFCDEDAERSRVEWATAIVAALAFPALERFAPGAFDHHNIELVFVAGAILSLMKMDVRPRLGAVGGVALGLAMATAAEALPFLAVGAVVAGLLWVFQPERYARGLFWLGAGVGVASLVSFIALVPPSQWQAGRCDAMSTGFLWFGASVSLVAMALGRALPVAVRGALAHRFGSAVGLGAIAGAGLLMLAPECLGGGYGDLDPDMMRLWMAQVSEARPLVQLWSDNLALFFAVSGAGIAGLVFAVGMVSRRVQFAPAWVAGAFLAAAVVMMLWQIRGAAFATAFAIPFAGFTIVRAQSVYRKQRTMRALATFACVAVASTAAAWGAIGQQVQRFVTPSAALSDFVARESDARACFSGDALAALDAAPTGLILNQFAIGSGVLAASGHSVLAAPYHRNADGTLAAINAFRSTPVEARKIVVDRGVSYVLVCDGLPEAQFYMAHPAGDNGKAEGTLAFALQTGETPEWLEPVALGDSPLRLYRVSDALQPALRGRF